MNIASHVVHGFVGNSCTTFPLQLHGFIVNNINSVQFSNHLGYGKFKGNVLTGNDVLELVNGLDENGLLKGYTHILTGFIGNQTFLENIVEVVKKVKTQSDVKYICDPVLGDNGKYYN